MTDATLDALRRAAERRGLDVDHADGRYVIRLQGSQATLWKSAHPDRILDRIERFRGRGR